MREHLGNRELCQIQTFEIHLFAKGVKGYETVRARGTTSQEPIRVTSSFLCVRLHKYGVRFPNRANAFVEIMFQVIQLMMFRCFRNELYQSGLGNETEISQN